MVKQEKSDIWIVIYIRIKGQYFKLKQCICCGVITFGIYKLCISIDVIVAHTPIISQLMFLVRVNLDWAMKPGESPHLDENCQTSYWFYSSGGYTRAIKPKN